MDPILLDKRVTLQKRAEGQDATGAALTGWANAITSGEGWVWANIKDLTGRQYVAAKAGQNAVSTTIRIRRLSGVLPAMRVMHGQVAYDIEAVLERDGAWLDLMCVKGVSNG